MPQHLQDLACDKEETRKVPLRARLALPGTGVWEPWSRGRYLPLQPENLLVAED